MTCAVPSLNGSAGTKRVASTQVSKCAYVRPSASRLCSDSRYALASATPCQAISGRKVDITARGAGLTNTGAGHDTSAAALAPVSNAATAVAG
jgi:hypothetical protein